MLNVREATVDDHDAVMGLMRNLHPHDPQLEAHVSTSVFQSIIDSQYFCILVVDIEGTLVGALYVNIIPNLTRNAASYGVIENVVTHSDFRRQGIGKALVESAIQYALSKNCYKVMLVTGGDKNVQKFYESCGMSSGSKTAFIVRNDR